MGLTYSLLLLAVAISLDSFSTGIAYGLRKVNIPFKSICIIAFCTAASLGVSMLAGQFLMRFISSIVANRIGGIILILIGCWVIYQFIRSQKSEIPKEEKKMVWKWEIKSMGIVIHILKKPTSADFDRSGTITGFEALLLGTALSLDAFGAGIGAAMLGYSPLVLASSAAVMSGLFLSTGIRIGTIFSRLQWMQKIAFFPGLLLILVGMLKM